MGEEMINAGELQQRRSALPILTPCRSPRSQGWRQVNACAHALNAYYTPGTAVSHTELSVLSNVAVSRPSPVTRCSRPVPINDRPQLTWA